METTPRPARRRSADTGHRELRLDIEGLRAVAVGLVVVCHSGMSRVAGGYVGVDVFFVISGFLITSALVRELGASGTISIPGFYARRALRLLPAAGLVIVSTLVGAWFFLSKVRFVEYAGDALAASLYAINLRLATTGTDYLAESSPPSPFQHFWSLAVEEQFYLLWPLVLIISHRVLGSRRLLWVPLLVLTLGSLALSVTLTGVSAPWSYFGPHTRIWELGLGALIALLVPTLRRLPAGAAAAMSWAGLGAIGLAALTYDATTAFPGHYALLPALGSALVIIGGGTGVRYGAGLVLSLRPATWLGGLSYGWYLWHWPLLIIGPEVVDRPPSLPFNLVLSGVALVLAWATLHAVENPVRFHPGLRRRPLRGLAVGAAISVVAASFALITAVRPPAIDSGAPAPDLRSALGGAADPERRLRELLDSAADKLPNNLSPALTEVQRVRSRVYRDGCHTAPTGTSPRSCEYGDRSSRKTVVLFGDSHAAQWFPAMDHIATRRGWRLVTMTKASCKLAEVTVVKDGKPYATCDRWRANVLRKIQRLKPELVIASSSDAGDPVRPMSDPATGWTEGFRKTFVKLAASGAEVAVILDTPWPRENAVDCVGFHPLDLARCSSKLSDAIKEPAKQRALRAAAKTSRRVAVIDPARWFCGSSGACPVVVGNVFVYRDESHMADAYSVALAPLLQARLPRI
ncbi:acyltransferase family protein [Thermomonospora umbrina]|uniref:acyltransferase family protein n=1 Tax=Thermomonospora umbrina TaxID=111806 RepID=UPI001B87C986|nr:acyltransferase family protein [Thermomonospora umbrina]